MSVRGPRGNLSQLLTQGEEATRCPRCGTELVEFDDGGGFIAGKIVVREAANEDQHHDDARCADILAARLAEVERDLHDTQLEVRLQKEQYAAERAKREEAEREVEALFKQEGTGTSETSLPGRIRFIAEYIQGIRDVEEAERARSAALQMVGNEEL